MNIIEKDKAEEIEDEVIKKLKEWKENQEVALVEELEAERELGERAETRGEDQAIEIALSNWSRATILERLSIANRLARSPNKVQRRKSFKQYQLLLQSIRIGETVGELNVYQQTLFRLGVALFWDSDYIEARRVLERLLELFPSDAKASLLYQVVVERLSFSRAAAAASSSTAITSLLPSVSDFFSAGS